MADTIEAVHPQYNAARLAWQRGRDLYAGTDAIKQYGLTVPSLYGASSASSPTAYLPRPQGMDDADFTFYKARACYFNALRRTVQALAGGVFRQPLHLEAPEELEQQAQDITLRDETLETLAREVVSEILTVGRCALLLDMSVTDARRPYWIKVAAESVTNWRSERVGPGPEQPTLVVLREESQVEGLAYEYRTVTRYRELRLLDGIYQVRTWDSTDGRFAPGPWIVPQRLGEPLDFIPFTFVGPTGLRTDVEPPPLDDLAYVSISHYRNSADHEHGLFLTALPTPWAAGVSGDTSSLRIGPSVCWQLDKDGRAGMLEFSGAGLAAIREAMAAKEKLMAALGARLLEDSTQRPETATGARLRGSGDAAALDTITSATQAALTKMLRWHGWWSGIVLDYDAVADLSVTLPSDFFTAKATSEEVRTALQMLLSEKISFATFYALLESGGWAREGVTAEAEAAAIAAEGGTAIAAATDDDGAAA